MVQLVGRLKELYDGTAKGITPEKLQKYQSIINNLNSQKLQTQTSNDAQDAPTKLNFVKPLSSVVDVGPGTEFGLVAKELGLNQTGGCACNALKKAMNKMGVENCLANKPELIKRLSLNYREFTIKDKAAVVWKLFKDRKIPEWLNIFNPVESMFDEAIKRASNQPE